MIKILNKVPKKEQPTNKYKFVIELMGGDADAYFYPEVLVDENNPYLERFVLFLKECSKKYPCGKGGDDDYSDIPDYNLFCSDDYPEEMMIDGEMIVFSDKTKKLFDNEFKKCGIHFDWEGNYEYFGISSYTGVKVTYLDNNGIEYKCEIE